MEGGPCHCSFTNYGHFGSILQYAYSNSPNILRHRSCLYIQGFENHSHMALEELTVRRKGCLRKLKSQKSAKPVHFGGRVGKNGISRDCGLVQTQANLEVACLDETYP